MIRVVLVGLGATGLEIGRILADRPDCELVGAIDPDPARLGQDLGDLLQRGTSTVRVAADLRRLPDADVAVVATTSHLVDVAPTLLALIERDLDVVGICEELSHPFRSHPELAADLDAAARAHGVSVMGTGCNPGMIMDTVPLVLSGLTRRVDRVSIQRRADMSRYGAILSKFGLGLTTTAFTEAAARGEVIGHVGFEQAVAALAAGLGWHLDDIVVDQVVPAIIAEEVRKGESLTVQPGTVAAVRHSARGMRGQVPVIELAVHFGFFLDTDPMTPGDRCVLTGAEQTLELTARAGYESFLSTVAIAANVVGAVVAARPGLRTMADLPVGALASKGRHTQDVLSD